MLALADERRAGLLGHRRCATPSTSTASKLSYRAVEGINLRPRTVSERLISFRGPTKHRRHYSMPQPRRRRHGLQPDRRRALELLAAVARVRITGGAAGAR